ncbi:hypothetical protein V8F06_008262 [Rhypophila decipiens]
MADGKISKHVNNCLLKSSTLSARKKHASRSGLGTSARTRQDEAPLTIRNPAPHDRFAASVPAIDTDHYEPFDIQHVQGKFGQADQWLAARLGKAISRRRQYFKYRERHHQKLAEGLALDHGADHGLSSHVTRDGVSTIASSIPEEVKGAPFDRVPLSTVDEDALSDSGAS